jgi:ABC-type sugar transport system ATPase subunit
MGSGRTELARILFGLDSYEQGSISINGKRVTGGTARSSIRDGLAFVTENRREEGLLMSIDIMNNIGMVALPSFVTVTQTIDEQHLREAAQQTANALQLKSGAIHRAAAKSLSGGNQQKVVIAKWLLSAPSVFIMDEPTRGIDVGAKYEIYSIVNQLAASGSAVLMISSELEELLGMCDRILVMSRGEIVSSFERAAFDEENILRAAFRETEPARAERTP